MSDMSDREIVNFRRLRAPQDLLFEAGTKAEALDRWMGPLNWLKRLGQDAQSPSGAA